ncbi:MAG: GIY-YIG nuclease family protein [Intestinibacter sp.]|uniref:GIY-YIG nuclease family protein n=1 Tax=Intestinibacter sp. TaxID=1965304 RepID=UPI002A821F41|nr:GIY-YIG nuclease family protein [Intestinibacter sp.]MDY4575669.1 GIY-YIG nuclease family protein [Intestinibacter sp.]
MKNEFYLKNFTSKWIKYSDYDMREDSNGNIYVIPAENSNYTIYDPFEKSNKILFDLIDLGDEALREEREKATIYNKLILFVKNYGLLGLISSSVYNRNIVGEQNILFTQNNIISNTIQNLENNSIMKSDEYIKLFTPFATEEDIYTREFDEHLTVVKAEDSPRFYGKKPLVMDIVFSKFYAERVDWIIEYAKNISKNLNQLIIYKNANLTEPVGIMPDKFNPQKIGFTVAMFDKPQIKWDFDSLQSTIDVIYAFALTDDNSILNRCSYCNKAFFAKTDREKYCSPSCRNCANVIKSRNKKKALKDQADKADEDKKIREKIKKFKGGENDMKNEKRKQVIYEYKEKKTTGGVYKITNTETGKSLIKGEIDLKSMENRFNFSVSINSCLNPKLQNDWKKYGPKSFKFEILEEVEKKSELDNRQFKKQLNELAEKYIEELDKEQLY